MGLFKDAMRKGIPGRDAGATMARPMQPQQAPRPTLIQGGPAYFTPEGYRPPMQPQQAFMPTDTMGDPIGDMFRRQLPKQRIQLPRLPPQKDPRDDQIFVPPPIDRDDPRFFPPEPIDEPMPVYGGPVEPIDMPINMPEPIVSTPVNTNPGGDVLSPVENPNYVPPSSPPMPPMPPMPPRFDDGSFPMMPPMDIAQPPMAPPMAPPVEDIPYEMSDEMRNQLNALDMDSIFNGGLDFDNINNIPAPIQEPIQMPQPPSRPGLPADFNPAAGIPGSGVPPVQNPGDFRDGLPSVTDFDNRFSASQLDDMRDKFRPEEEPVEPPYEMGVVKQGPFDLPDPDMSGKFTPFTQEVGTDPNAIDRTIYGNSDDLRARQEITPFVPPDLMPTTPPVQSVTTPQPFLQEPQAPRTGGIPSINDRNINDPRGPINTVLPEPPMDIAPPMAPPRRSIAPPSFEREPREMPREAPIQAPTPPAQIEQIKQVLPQLPPEQLMDILPQLPPEVIQELPEELIRQIMPMMPEPMMPETMQPRMPMPGPIATPPPRLQRPSLPMMPMMGGRGRR